MKIITQNDILEEIQKGLQQGENCVIVEYTDNQVNYGFDSKPNFEYCQKHNIPCYDIGRRGGTFVINKGDIGFGCITKGLDNTTGELLYNKFAEYLQYKGLNVTKDSNDILINGYKVFGWSSHYYAELGLIFITAHFTMSVDLEKIKNICTKPMNKIPKGLSEFGITAEEVKEFIKNTIE